MLRMAVGETNDRETGRPERIVNDLLDLGRSITQNAIEKRFDRTAPPRRS